MQFLPNWSANSGPWHCREFVSVTTKKIRSTNQTDRNQIWFVYVNWKSRMMNKKGLAILMRTQMRPLSPVSVSFTSLSSTFITQFSRISSCFFPFLIGFDSIHHFMVFLFYLIFFFGIEYKIEQIESNASLSTGRW